LLARLRDLMGASSVIAEPDRLIAYESDALTYLRGTPLAALLPGSRDEVRSALEMLHEASIPFVPRGSGTGISGGAVADGAVLISTARMNRILAIDVENRTAIVEPGVVTATISEAAAAHGLRYLPDPASAAACSIGGNVAQNAGGPHCLKHGVTSDHVLGLEVVRPDGSLVELGRGEDGGLDLGALFIGSEGTLGIVTRITVRLFPVVPAVGTALALFPLMETAGWAVSEILASGVTPVAIEMLDQGTIRIVESSPFAAGLPTDVGAALIVEVEGDPEEVEVAVRRAAEVARASGATEVRVAADEEERARLWQARKKAYGVLGRRAPEVLVQDAVVPRTRIAPVLERIGEIARAHELENVNYFHAGDGNLHPHLLFDPRDPDQLARVGRASEEIMRVCVEAGGTITGEHGVGLDKRRAMRLVFTDAELDAMRALKRALDPAGSCNPGKMLPPEEAEVR
jgi:glycolate oxidase subunit GlcD